MGWNKLTGMAWNERGIAVALSLGGKAGRVAKSIPHEVLGREDGLYLLLQRIENEFGAELQDRVRTAHAEYSKFRRPRGMNASEYCTEFERLYQDANQHGLSINTVMLTINLLEHAGLSKSQEEWILQTVAGDLSRYQEIKQALRRLPELDSRHRDSSAWPVLPASEPHQSDSKPYSFQDSHINYPPPEAYAAQASSSSTDVPHAYMADEDSDSDDDYCSTCVSNAPEQEQLAINCAWAAFRFKKSSDRKKFGKRPRKGQFRSKNTWMADNRRNYSDEVPQGWDKTKWLARTPCKGCGSRWHRQCGGEGKKAHFIRKKGGGKGGAHSSHPQGGKGGFQKKTHFVFLTSKPMYKQGNGFSPAGAGGH